jgi:hypothetical protein
MYWIPMWVRASMAVVSSGFISRDCLIALSPSGIDQVLAFPQDLKRLFADCTVEASLAEVSVGLHQETGQD